MSKRLKEIEILLEEYYGKEDPFEQTELAITLLHSHVGYLINQANQTIELAVAYNNAQKEIRILKNMNMSVSEIVRHSEGKDKIIKELEGAIKGSAVITNIASEKIKGLNNQNKRYREALRFYADETKYEDRGDYWQIVNDEGKTARNAIRGEGV